MKRLVLLFGLLAFINSQSAKAESTEIKQKGPFQSTDGLTIFVRAEGPATRDTPLQISCFFEHQKDGDTLSGGTEAFNEKMGGLIKELRDNGDFKGNELETLLITPPKDTIPAKKLLLIGLGDQQSFTAERMRKVASVAVREAFKAGVTKFSFSPNVTDAGITNIPVQDFDQQIAEGVLETYKIQTELSKKQVVPNIVLKEFTLEAGEKNLPYAELAVKTAIGTIQ